MRRYGDHLSELIKERGLTQRELAKMTSLDESTISLYISNKRVPNLKNHIKICNALGVEVNFFSF